MIKVDGISKYYGEFLAVNNISFSIKDGEITGLLGPNGAGKTTTLRMLTAYLKPSEGSVNVNDKDVVEDPLAVKKMIGYLPESAPIYGDMLVYDYLLYVSEMREIESKDRIKEIAKLCGITEVMHKNINELSKGYKQRVGLSHAMIHDPDILSLDEPTSGLDPNQIIEIRNLIKEIGKTKTVILSTHILSEVEATCDRVIIINNGNIVADDRTENLQSLTGEKNIISVKLKGADFDAASAVLKNLDGVTSVTRESDNEFTSLSVTTQASTDARPEIFQTVVDNSWTLYEIKQEQQSLESVFREVTTGGNNE
jgi:ABC-2 type transport system ATP-binding protein